MKKMLIVEEPDSCEECPLRSYSNLMLVCTPMREAASDVECPLRPLPMKRETHVYWNSVGIGSIPTHEITDYDKGWNDCIDFLEGDMQDD